MLLIIILVLLAITFGRVRSQKTRRNRPAAASEERGRRTCPLCGSVLAPGERVRSVIYRSPGDTLAEVYGCPHCHGEHATREPKCPVCRKPVPRDGYVIARMFKRPEKVHMHVLGCTSCRSRW